MEHSDTKKQLEKKNSEPLNLASPLLRQLNVNTIIYVQNSLKKSNNESVYLT